MKVVLHIITGLDDGGAEAVLHRICINDNVNRHVVVSMMDEGKYGPLLKEAGIKLHCLDAQRGRFSLIHMLRLWSIVRITRPDVVQTWMYHANLIGGIISYLAGARNIVWSLRHVYLSADDSKLTTRLIDKASAIISRLIPRRIIAISNKVSEAHLSRGYARKFTVIYNGCDTNIFAPSHAKRNELMQSFKLQSGSPIIGCVARWTPEKDHATLLKAIQLASNICEFQVILAGTGCTKENGELTAIIRALDIQERVVLAGPRNDIPEIMNLLDVHILPSKNEAFGNVIIEAMSSGTPCISTDVGDAKYIIGNTGWIVNREDPISMAKSIESVVGLIVQKEAWNERSIKSRARITSEFSLESMIMKYSKIWNS